MKIGHVSMYYKPIVGGQQTYISNLIKVLNEHDFESTVYQPRVPGFINDKDVNFAPHIPKGHYLKLFLNNWHWFIFNLSLKLCRRSLEQQDVLISNYSFHYPSLKWHHKVIILSHGVLWENAPKTFFDKYHQKISKNLFKEKAYIVANDTHFLREIGFDIAPGQGFFSEIAKNVWFIPNCVDTTYFLKLPEVKKEKIILVPRNIRHDRGIHLAIEAFAIFNIKHPDFILKIVGGPTNGGYFDYCRNLVSKLNLEDKVKFPGFIPWEEMVTIYNEATITLVPTLEKEGTSLSALESMACGTAVVSTDIAGLKDIPCVKAEPVPADVALKLEETLTNLDAIAIKQLHQIQTVFNLKNWAKAWIQVVNQVYNK